MEFVNGIKEKRVLISGKCLKGNMRARKYG